MTVSIKGFKFDDGVELIRDWYRTAHAKVKATFDVRIKYLTQRKPQDWKLPYYYRLHGECAGLSEIRFKANGAQHRPIGFFSGDNEFTILVFATEKGGKLAPKSSCKTAQERKKLIKEIGGGHTHEWEIKG